MTERRPNDSKHGAGQGELVPKLPNFIYIGPDKAGSSWLHEVLIRHEQVFMPDAKDLYFFDRYYDRGLSWYATQFKGAAPGHEIVGEVCQDYLFHPQAAERIKDSLGGDVRLMVTLRDPIERAFSSYLYMLKQGETPGTFLDALGSRPELLEHGRYATNLQRYFETFGRDNVYVAVFDDLAADPQQFIDRLLAWLQLDPMVLGDDLVEARLPAGKARSAALARVARRAADFVRERDGANLVGRVKRSSIVQRTLYRPLASDKPTMTAQEREAVLVPLTSEIEWLDENLGLNLRKRWGWSAIPAPRAVSLPLEAETA
jgi:Sulfotransferase family